MRLYVFLIMVLLPCLTTAHYMHFKSYKSEEESSEEKSSPSQEEKSSPKTASEEDDSKMKEMMEKELQERVHELLEEMREKLMEEMKEEREEERNKMEMKNHTYMFGYGIDWKPYEYLNMDGDLVGFNYDIVRSVCKVMHKQCQHVVYYDYATCWDSMKKSNALNNRWFDACVGMIPTTTRRQVYSFVGEFAHEPPASIYVREDSKLKTMQDIIEDAERYGFRNGHRTTPKCLAKFLEIDLDTMSELASYYDSAADMEKALGDKNLDVIFLDDSEIEDMEKVRKINSKPISCSDGGPALGVRKDDRCKFAWFEEGLHKLKNSGDYDWLCSRARKDGNPACQEVERQDSKESYERESED